jgi:AbrB family looped-hinge helix DNA binding protein
LKKEHNLYELYFFLLYMTLKTMKVNKKGMITIPNEIREKYNIVEGSEVLIIEILGEIQIIPLIDFETIKKQLPSRKDMKEVYFKSKETELELEK